MRITKQSRVEKHRLFLAIFLPKEIKHEIQRIAEKATSFNWPLRIVPANNLHLTVRFLDYLDSDQIRKITNKLLAVTCDFKYFDLKIKSVIEFPPPKPSMVCVDLLESNDLTRLVQNIEDGLSPLVFIKKDRRLFNPHITVARLKRYIPNLSTRMSDLRIKPLSWQVRGVELVESFLKKEEGW